MIRILRELWLFFWRDLSIARTYRTEAEVICRALDGYWLPEERHYRSRVLASGKRSTKERAKDLDIAVILAAIHARGHDSTHTARDPHMHSTLQRLEDLFDSA